MLESALEFLCCPGCGPRGDLLLEERAPASGEEIDSGRARCQGCGREYPIDGGILDLVGPNLSKPHLSQRLMEAVPVVRIYENSWRPALVNSIQAGFGFDEEARLVSRLLKAAPGHVVADLACGPGNYTRRWAKIVGPEEGAPRTRKKAGGIALGLDRSRPMLKEAVRRARAEDVKNVAYIRCDAHQLPLRPGSVDGASCCAALHLFENPGGVLRQLSEAMRPGSRFVCVTVQLDERPLTAWMQQASELVTGLHFFGSQELKNLCDRAGLEWLEEKNLGPIWLFGTRRKAEKVSSKAAGGDFKSSRRTATKASRPPRPPRVGGRRGAGTPASASETTRKKSAPQRKKA